MKKFMVGILGLIVLAGVVCADTYTYSYVAAANSTNTSDAIPVSGYLDKIELSGLGATRTNSILIATYASNSGTNPVDTVALVTSLTTPKVIRPRVQPTDSTGTVIPAAVYAAAGITNVGTVLTVSYDKILVGGNMKIENKNDHPNAVTNTIVFYFEPLKK